MGVPGLGEGCGIMGGAAARCRRVRIPDTAPRRLGGLSAQDAPRRHGGDGRPCFRTKLGPDAPAARPRLRSRRAWTRSSQLRERLHVPDCEA